MSEAPFKTLQIRVETLPAVYTMLVKALSETGLSGTILNEIISKHVSSACVLCGIEIKGDDLSAMTLARHSEDLSDARLARLKQGYCCRRSCQSYYYKLLFAPHPSVNWEKVFEKLIDTKAWDTGEPTQEQADRSRKALARRMLIIKIAAGVGLMLMLLVVRHLMSGGSLPGLKREPKYKVDPASIPTVPGR